MEVAPRGGGKTVATVRLARLATRLRGDLPLALLDTALIAAAYVAGLLLRFDGAVPSKWWLALRLYLPVAIGVHLAWNAVFGLYGQMWRHASVHEARRVLSAGLCSTAVLGILFLPGIPRRMPISVVVVGGVAAMMLLGAQRFHSRLFAFRHAKGRMATRVVVIGAGDSGAALVRDMCRSSSDSDLRPVAILDDDPAKRGRRISGVPVIGGIEQMPMAVARRGAEMALLAIASADGALVRRVANIADSEGVPLKVLPTVSELINGQASVRDVRDLSIDDLLGRQQVNTDLAAVEATLRGRRVLITGAGGSIGAEIARQVAACGPSALLLLDHDETHLYDAAATVTGEAVQLLADIRDTQLITRLFERYQPEVVFHAAAHKHVPLLESHPCEAVATNVLGTANVVRAAAAVGVERFVFVSTDKAVRPKSVMGASKRLGEQVLLASAPPGRPYCAVRFGNVLGSRGSVIPTFIRQIQRGDPLTITDPRMTRFFMTIEEAVQLVLQAAALSRGGEVFMLEMGQAVRIVDLAERMIRLSGRRVGLDVPIRITGVRPGEKLVEELHTPEEMPSPTAHPAIVALHPSVIDGPALTEALERLAVLTRRHDDAETATTLFSLASPGFQEPGPEAEPSQLAQMTGTS